MEEHSQLHESLRKLRNRLLETSTRNRLVHVNRKSKRVNALNIVNEKSDEIYGLLRGKERKLRFRARDEDEPAIDTTSDRDRVVNGSKRRIVSLQTELSEDALEKRLLKLFLDAKNAEEERGANFLFLALSFLRWYEKSKFDAPREAPLVLLPVQLSRSRFTFDITARPEDITSNLTLLQRLKGDYGVELPEINEDVKWTPGEYFNQVATVILSNERWSIDRDGIQLGFFFFSKALMYRDLQEENWSNGGLVHKALVRRLLDPNQEIGDPPPRLGLEPKDRLDEYFEPKDFIHVLDTDASQAKAIEEVRAGRNLIIQGPPGTGKSQTITNIIAAAAFDGKKVLFMAEKMAALKVVYDRLVKAGLGKLCLELHSRTANKKAFYQELNQTIEVGRTVPDITTDAKDLTDVRDALNSIDDILHHPLEGKDYSPFDVIAEFCRFFEKDDPPELDSEEFENLTNYQRDEISEAIRAYGESLKVTGPPDKHPFYKAHAFNLHPPDVTRLDGELSEARDSVEKLLKTVGTLAKRLGIETAHDMAAMERFGELIGLAEKASEGLGKKIEQFSKCENIDLLKEKLKLFKIWKDERDEEERKFSDKAWYTSVEELRTRIAAGLGSLLVRWFGKYRSASKQFAELLKGDLPRLPDDRLALVEDLISAQRKENTWLRKEEWLQRELGKTYWRGKQTDIDALLEAVEWIQTTAGKLREVALNEDSVEWDQVVAVCDLRGDAKVMGESFRAEWEGVRQQTEDVDARLKFEPGYGVGRQDSLKGMLVSLQRMQKVTYDDWRRLQRCREKLVELNLEDFALRIESHSISPDRAVREFLYAVAEARWKYAVQVRPELSEVDYLDRHQWVGEYRDLDDRRLREVKDLVRYKHLDQLPTGASGEMGFLHGEFQKKKRHRQVRQAFSAAPNMIPRIKPVILMSPISIAQFLPPEEISFDLLLIDEASQVRPEDALGGAARARQIVVVGDDMQLPPTSFFERLVDDQGDDDEIETDVPLAASAAEMESILDLAHARGINQVMLNWHYRSRDPSLIKVSNKEFYKGGLILPPSPYERDNRCGISLTRVKGVYSSSKSGRGRAGTNQIEAECIADALTEIASAEDTKIQSVGVVAFSKAQSDMITEVLEIRRRKDNSLDALLREGKNEDFFVKNIENVQGDERDVILVSVGYGPLEAGGRLSKLRFGPINIQGGERRLNVLFTRARWRCEIFVSFDWRDIDLNRAQAKGPKVLRNYLEFADTKRLESDSKISTVNPDSYFEEAVAQFITECGYPVDHHVGSSGFRIDLGVRDPERSSQYILAVECDGASYHSSLWSRERDKLRQQVLESQGWRFHRIWSTDWFHRLSREKERLVEALEQARKESQEGFRPPTANFNCQFPESVQAASGTDHLDEDTRTDLEVETDPLSSDFYEPRQSRLSVAYQHADITYDSSVAPHKLKLEQMVELVRSIVEQEGPVHKELVAFGITRAELLNRTGSVQRIQISSNTQKAVNRALKQAVRQDAIDEMGDFYLTPQQRENPPVRNRSGIDNNSKAKKSDFLPPIEICAAAKLVERENGTLGDLDQIRAILELLGFKRTGDQLKKRVAEVLKGCS